MDALERADAHNALTKTVASQGPYSVLMALKGLKMAPGFPQIIVTQSAATDRRGAQAGVFSPVITTCLPHAPPAGNGHHWPWYRLPGPMAFLGCGSGTAPNQLNDVCWRMRALPLEDAFSRSVAAGLSCRCGTRIRPAKILFQRLRMLYQRSSVVAALQFS